MLPSRFHRPTASSTSAGRRRAASSTSSPTCPRSESVSGAHARGSTMTTLSSEQWVWWLSPAKNTLMTGATESTVTQLSGFAEGATSDSTTIWTFRRRLGCYRSTSTVSGFVTLRSSLASSRQRPSRRRTPRTTSKSGGGWLTSRPSCPFPIGGNQTT